MIEHDVQSEILEHLKRRRYFFWRNNSGMMKKGRHYVRFGSVGSPDIFCVIKGHCFGIEVKRPGGKQSEAQVKFQDGLRGAEGTYLLVESLEDLLEVMP